MPGLPRAGEEPRRNHPGKPPALLPKTPPHPSRLQPGNLYICEVPLTIALSSSEQHEAGKSGSHGEHLASSEFCTRMRWRRETAPEPGLQSNPRFLPAGSGAMKTLTQGWWTSSSASKQTHCKKLPLGHLGTGNVVCPGETDVKRGLCGPEHLGNIPEVRIWT